MRTFIAIDLTRENKDVIAGLQKDLQQVNANVKWVETENIHLTLKFLGEVTEEYVPKVKDALTKVTAQFKPYEISLSGIGAFPKLDFPRVIWVGIEKGKKETEEIVVKLEDELSKLGFSKEDRPFSAHLTIGRVRSAKNKEVLKEKILAHSPELIAHSQQLVSRVAVYQSTLTPQGPIYTVLHEAKLLS